MRNLWVFMILFFMASVAFAQSVPINSVRQEMNMQIDGGSVEGLRVTFLRPSMRLKVKATFSDGAGNSISGSFTEKAESAMGLAVVGLFARA